MQHVTRVCVCSLSDLCSHDIVVEQCIAIVALLLSLASTAKRYRTAPPQVVQHVCFNGCAFMCQVACHATGFAVLRRIACSVPLVFLPRAPSFAWFALARVALLASLVHVDGFVFVVELCWLQRSLGRLVLCFF